jgi:uncharacterized protein (DUF697 family)
MPPTEPRRTPMSAAARSPIGVNQVTRTTKIRDVLVVIIVPLAIPAAVLPMANGPSSLTLTNLAFGFVAVAIAGVARAVAAKTDEWLTYALVALTCVCLQTALAVVNDTSEASNSLREVVSRETAHPGVSSLSNIREALMAAVNAEPSAFHWICSTVIGLTLVTLSFELIRREQ